MKRKCIMYKTKINLIKNRKQKKKQKKIFHPIKNTRLVNGTKKGTIILA